MKRWESLVEEKIREAMAHGEFDNLAGKGKPLDLSENPFEDPDWRTAHRMLRNAGFAPAWIEERKEIDNDFVSAQERLARSWKVLKNAHQTENEAAATSRWERSVADFRRYVNQLNRRVVAWNLKAPAAGFHIQRIDPEKEILRLQQG